MCAEVFFWGAEGLVINLKFHSLFIYLFNTDSGIWHIIYTVYILYTYNNIFYNLFLISFISLSLIGWTLSISDDLSYLVYWLAIVNINNPINVRNIKLRLHCTFWVPNTIFLNSFKFQRGAELPNPLHNISTLYCDLDTIYHVNKGMAKRLTDGIGTVDEVKIIGVHAIRLRWAVAPAADWIFFQIYYINYKYRANLTRKLILNFKFVFM